MTCKCEQHLQDSLFMRYIWNIVFHRHWRKGWVFFEELSTIVKITHQNMQELRVHQSWKIWIASQIFMLASKVFLKYWQDYSMTHSHLLSFRNVTSNGDHLMWSDRVILKLTHHLQSNLYRVTNTLLALIPATKYWRVIMANVSIIELTAHIEFSDNVFLEWRPIYCIDVSLSMTVKAYLYIHGYEKPTFQYGAAQNISQR